MSDITICGRVFSHGAIARAKDVREQSRAIVPYASIRQPQFLRCEQSLEQLLSEHPPPLDAATRVDRMQEYNDESIRQSKSPRSCYFNSFVFAFAAFGTYLSLSDSHPEFSDKALSTGLLSAPVQISINDGDVGTAGLLLRVASDHLELPLDKPVINDLMQRARRSLKERMKKIPPRLKPDTAFRQSVYKQLMYPDIISALLLNRNPKLAELQ